MMIGLIVECCKGTCDVIKLKSKLKIEINKELLLLLLCSFIQELLVPYHLNIRNSYFCYFFFFFRNKFITKKILLFIIIRPTIEVRIISVFGYCSYNTYTLR